ncbi:MAG: Gfo/Idh/MocA family oxidoreductase [Caldilineaceae bacterium SB0675_bin_29]|uniref:Gfo/Idh/MocA family oxidoreductase n=1 Tax=Caldilineaceae bacterium SB0675_bin_29 TaxID=2605266 RepID=A0A6B1G9B6_9CHLR|nr:Gfo/Idh/MocA family oxidoreductase [Caldilineaceae bacterium SB0675_bin_29]
MSVSNVAIVGTGFMGPAHTEGLRRLGINVAGILGSSAEKSQRAASDLGIPKAYNDLADLLADAEIEAVHITSPNRHHFEQASQTLRAGKHVHCEKPLAMTSAESGALVQLASESGLAAGVNYNMRFYPLNWEVRSMIQSGALGRIHSITGGYVQDWLLYPTDYNWRVLSGEGGKLRAVADIGTHWLDLVQFITGLSVTAVQAALKTVHTTRQRPTGEVETFSAKVQVPDATESIDIETEDSGAALLRFSNGAHGSLWVSQITAGRKNCLRYEIAGSEASVAWNSEQPNELWIGHRNQANQLLLRDPGLVSEAALAHIGYPGGHNEGYDDSFKHSFKSFYDYIAAGDLNAPQPFPTFADGHKEILHCQAILQRHEPQKWVEIDE